MNAAVSKCNYVAQMVQLKFNAMCRITKKMLKHHQYKWWRYVATHFKIQQNIDRESLPEHCLFQFQEITQFLKYPKMTMTAKLSSCDFRQKKIYM